MERFINILIIDNNPKNQKGLKAILSGGGNNILFADHIEQAFPIIQKKEIGILLINIDDPSFGGLELLHTLKEKYNTKVNFFKIDYLIQFYSKNANPPSINDIQLDKKFIFLCQNRQPHYHRILLLTYLKNLNLLYRKLY